MTLSFVNIVMIVAAAQGFLLAVLLLKKHRALLANWLLAVMIVCYSILLLYLTIGDVLYDRTIAKPIAFLAGLSFLVAPLQDLYAKYLINLSKRIYPRDWLHAIPFVCVEILIFASMSTSSEGEIGPYNAEPAHIPLFYIYFNWAIVLIGLIYVALLLSLIKSYHQRIKNLFSTIERIRLDWLQRITYVTLATWTMFTVENALFTAGINLSNFDISSLMVGLCVYSVGYWGLMKSEVFVSPDVVSALAGIDTVNPSPINLSEDRIKSASLKYEKSGLSQEDARQYGDRVKQLMEKEHLYTDSNMTLGKLANRLSISSHNLSEVINTQLQQNFYDFVNRYRVEQVKRDLLDPIKQHLTIIALAFDAGFNSKAAFNTVFKEYTNQTPSEYRKAY